MELIDTTAQPVADTVDVVASWIERTRSQGTPLSHATSWWEKQK